MENTIDEMVDYLNEARIIYTKLGFYKTKDGKHYIPKVLILDDDYELKNGKKAYLVIKLNGLSKKTIKRIIANLKIIGRKSENKLDFYNNIKKRYKKLIDKRTRVYLKDKIRLYKRVAVKLKKFFKR